MLSLLLCAAAGVACNGILGITDVEVIGPGDDGGGGADALSPLADGGLADGSVNSDGSVLPDGAPAGSVGGVLHFMQNATTVTLGSGADSVVVSANGAFTLPLKLGPAAKYDVQVTKNPAGQECWVKNGKGTVGTPTPGLEVRCTVVKASVGTSTDTKTTSSSVYAAMDDLADVVFQNDVAAQTLLALSIPNVSGLDNDLAQYRIGIFVDGVLERENVGRSEQGSPSQTTSTVLAVPTLAPGSHTIRAVWRRVDGSRVDGVTRRIHNTGAGSYLRPELDVVVLDSLSTFDRYVSSSTTNGLSLTRIVETDVGVPALTFNNAAKQKAMFVTSLPDVSGEAQAMMYLDGAAIAGQRKVLNFTNQNQAASYTTLALRDVDPGSHSVNATIYQYQNNQSLGSLAGEPGLATNAKKPAAIHGFLWQPQANIVGWDSGGARIDVTPNGDFTTGGTPVDITVSKPSKALVVMDLHRFSAELAGSNSPSAEASVFVGGVVGPSIYVGRTGFDDSLRSSVGNRFAIVDLPAGKTTLDLRFRNSPNYPMYILSGTRFGAIVLE